MGGYFIGDPDYPTIFSMSSPPSDSKGGYPAASSPPPSSGSSPASSSDADNGSIDAISIKLPPYWPADPALWFAQIEAVFGTRRITSQVAKFQHVVGNLSPEYAVEVRDLLVSPPESNPYDALREALVRRTQESESKRLRQLMVSEELGDRKPSQLLRRMNQLLSGKQMDEAFAD